jgi:hypothetical protein
VISDYIIAFFVFIRVIRVIRGFILIDQGFGSAPSVGASYCRLIAGGGGTTIVGCPDRFADSVMFVSVRRSGSMGGAGAAEVLGATGAAGVSGALVSW